MKHRCPFQELLDNSRLIETDLKKLADNSMGLKYSGLGLGFALVSGIYRRPSDEENERSQFLEQNSLVPDGTED